MADGVIRLRDIGNLEVVLLETSQAYSMATETKKSFDLHKATFGLLAMLRAIAVLFPKGTFNTFRQLRLFFVHPARKIRSSILIIIAWIQLNSTSFWLETSVRLWSISCPSKNTFLMVCEERAAVPVVFRYKEKQLKQFVSLWIHLSVSYNISFHEILLTIPSARTTRHLQHFAEVTKRAQYGCKWDQADGYRQAKNYENKWACACWRTERWWRRKPRLISQCIARASFEFIIHKHIISVYISQ